MSSDLAQTQDVVRVEKVSKAYTLYRRSSDRLLHLLMPWRTYPSFTALEEVSFRVRRGETVGIIGENGAGKSTLLQIITGTVMPTGGEAQVNGRVAALLELGAGFEPDFSGRENVYINGTILGLTRAGVEARMDDIIAFSELEEFIDRPVKTYSSGMFMRLAFSVAAHVDADVLIIDEALSVGDARFTQKCMRFLSDFKRKGSILFVSHDLGAVAGLCDRAIWLDHGQVRAEGEAGRICEQYVESLFVEPEDIAAAEGADTHESPTLAPPPNTRIKTTPFNAAEGSVQIAGGPLPPLAPPGMTVCSPFNPAANSFGIGGAKVVDASLLDAMTGQVLTQVSDGQTVDLQIVAEADAPVPRPIFGFYIKDRLGQNLLGENSFSDSETGFPMAPGDVAAIRFRFVWPALAKGTYALTVAIADGTMADHVQRHWLHDAIMFDVISTSARHGLVGLNITSVVVERGSL